MDTMNNGTKLPLSDVIATHGNTPLVFAGGQMWAVLRGTLEEAQRNLGIGEMGDLVEVAQ